MFFKLGKGIAWFTLMLSVNLGTKVMAEQQQAVPDLHAQAMFAAKPANCVALRQGRKCYAKVSLIWQTAIKGDFCIYQKTNNKVLQCWHNSQGNQVTFEFESSENIAYQLIASEQKEVIAETSVDVSWVHNATPRKRRWRLF